jgi:glycosyltransferase involved in cell wall biosynthesis
VNALHIVLTVNYSPWSAFAGGGQHSTHHLACALRALGHEVVVVYTRALFDRFTPPPVPYRIEYATFAALEARAKSPLRPLNSIFVRQVVKRLITDGRRSVVHCQGEEGALLPRLKRAGLPFRLVATPRHGAYPARLKPRGGSIAEAVGRVAVSPKLHLLGALLRGADVICPTSHTASMSAVAAFGIPWNRIRIVPNGVEPAFLAVERTAARNAASDNGPVVYFGRIEHNKGVDLLVEAVAGMTEPRPEVLIVGRGAAEADLRNRVARAGLPVRFLGWQSPDALCRILEGAALAVLPSREESFGNAIVEAMAAGIPLITTRAGAIPEVVGDTGAALLVPADDAPALRGAMREVLSWDAPRRNALGAAGRERVRTRFSWTSSAEQLTRVYEAAWQSAPVRHW